MLAWGHSVADDLIASELGLRWTNLAKVRDKDYSQSEEPFEPCHSLPLRRQWRVFSWLTVACCKSQEGRRMKGRWKKTHLSRAKPPFLGSRNVFRHTKSLKAVGATASTAAAAAQLHPCSVPYWRKRSILIHLNRKLQSAFWESKLGKRLEVVQKCV